VSRLLWARPGQRPGRADGRAPHWPVDLAAQVVLVGLPAPVLELQFAPPRRWRFDLAWPRWLVAVEVDGATFVGGRHTRGVGYERDCEKLAEAVLAGWRVLRVTPAMVADGRARAYVERALRPPALRGEASPPAEDSPDQ